MPADQAALRAQLTTLGETPVPGPSAAFLAGLERRLADEPDLGTTNLVAMPRRRRAWGPAMFAAAASIAVITLATALLGGFDGGHPSGLQLGSAVDTTVRLPGGHIVTGHRGLTLPNGAILQTGPNGSAAAGSVDLGPGLQGVVTGGRLHLSPTTVPTTPGAPVTTPSGSRSGQTPPITLPKITLPPITLPKLPLPALPIPTTLPHLLP